MLLFAVPVAALALGLLLGLLRFSVALAAGVAVFVVLAAYGATRPREPQDGEPITGVAAVGVTMLWVLSALAARRGLGVLVRRRGRAGS